MAVQRDELSFGPRSSFQEYRSLEPVLQAYALAFASTTLPRLIPLYLATVRGNLSIRDVVSHTFKHARRQLQVDRFPTVCAILIFAATWLPQQLFRLLYGGTLTRKLFIARRTLLQTVITFISTFIAGLLSFGLLKRQTSKQQPHTSMRTGREVNAEQDKSGSGLNHTPLDKDEAANNVTLQKNNDISASKPLAGRTIDLTIFLACRAFDILLIATWRHFNTILHTKPSYPKTEKFLHFLEAAAPPTLFALSSSLVMHAWFYTPSSLPPSYNAWITTAASIDPRLIQALRGARAGTFVYGRGQDQDKKGEDLSLVALAHDLSLPQKWGDPAQTVPIPCELYHSGAGASCEWHALTRFVRGWAFGMRMYLPLHLLILLRHFRRPKHLGLRSSVRRIRVAIISAARSSTFLATFITLFYYGVCLARTRIGPFLVPRTTGAAQFIEAGPAVRLGSLLCGWSILLEKPSRRMEIAAFVAPRAVATCLPRAFEARYLWREGVVFAASVGVVLTAIQSRPRDVRGVFGGVLASVVGA